MSYWAVAMTHPMAEAKAADHLARQGFEHYAPRYLTHGVRGGRRVQSIRPLFPRYIFFLVVDQWYAIKSTIGIATVLLAGDKPARVRDALIDAIRMREHKGIVMLPRDKYAIGQRVQIQSGKFKGIFGLYQGMTSREREVVLLDHLGRVELAAGDLQ